VLVGLPAKHAPKAELAAYAHTALIWFWALIISFFSTTVFAALVVRQTREEYLEESAENLRSLVEGTLEDHRKKSGSEPKTS